MTARPVGAGPVDAEAWGVLPGFHGTDGEWVPASPEGTAAALESMQATAEGPPEPTTWVVTPREHARLPAPGLLVYEDGGTEPVAGALPELPLGYHRVEFDDRAVRLIVSPGACVLPARRMWGWAVQLYATRSQSSWGIGDLGDLGTIGAWAGSMGASVVMINPLHAVAPTPEQQPSPYFPSSRRWRNPLYLRVEDVPGAAHALGKDLEPLVTAGRELNGQRIIDRGRIWALKRTALERVWAATGGQAASRPEFTAWAQTQGEELTSFATYAALAEGHGPDWRSWRPGNEANPVAVLGAGASRARVLFHAWVQWLIDVQLSAAAARATAAGVGLLGDLAVAGDPGGADAWIWPGILAGRVTIGAPPDHFAPGGQDWGLPPWDPWWLRGAGYQPFIEVVRAAMQHMSGVRIDHAAGLFRQFWVPADGDPRSGVYVRYPWADLCHILALESHRSGAFVVAEDLGTVEPWARSALAERDVLSYRLAWFEPEPPDRWPRNSLAAVTTHDLPTVAGVWTGADAETRRRVGLDVDDATDAKLRHVLVSLAGEGTTSEVTVGAYRAVANSPALVVAATLEDALEVTERPNHPGSVDEWPNWCLALPLAWEEIAADPRLAAVAQACNDAGRKGQLSEVNPGPA